jgi:hypothetical protein
MKSAINWVVLISATLAANPLLAKENFRCESSAAANMRALGSEVQQAAMREDFKAAENTIVDLETAWIVAEPDLRPVDEVRWKEADNALSNAVALLQRARPGRDSSLKAVLTLQNALISICKGR